MEKPPIKPSDIIATSFANGKHPIKPTIEYSGQSSHGFLMSDVITASYNNNSRIINTIIEQLDRLHEENLQLEERIKELERGDVSKAWDSVDMEDKDGNMLNQDKG